MQDWILALGVGFALSAMFGWLINKLPKILGKWLDKKIDFIFEKGGPAEDKLFYALVVYAEHKLNSEFADGKKGEEKFKLVADKIMTLLMPALDFLPAFVKSAIIKKSDKLAVVIEHNVKIMKYVLDKNQEEHKGDIENVKTATVEKKDNA